MADMSPNLELEFGYWKKGYSISRWHSVNKRIEMGNKEYFQGLFFFSLTYSSLKSKHYFLREPSLILPD